MNHYQDLDKLYHFPTYGRFPITLERGQGARVWDIDGVEYVDGLAGIAVNSLGHNHPQVVKAICEQSQKLMHTSNFFTTKPNSELSEFICKQSGMDKVFYCNSGAEATEGAVKAARLYNHKAGKTNCDIICMENSFHGRTIATIAMGKAKYQEGFSPLPEGFVKAKINDLEDLKAKINEKTGAIIIETIQGEGGIVPAEIEFLKSVEKICRENKILFIIDEVQCGIGRTGFLFAYQFADIKPDIVCVAKGIAAGFPMGAVLATNAVANSFEPGNHGTTFGGNPLACAVSLATLNVICSDGFLDEVKNKGNYFINELKREIGSNKNVKEIRGLGLMIGVELYSESKPIVLDLLERKVIINSTANNVIRIVPPLVIEFEEIDIIVNSIKESLNYLLP